MDRLVGSAMQVQSVILSLDFYMAIQTSCLLLLFYENHVQANLYFPTVLTLCGRDCVKRSPSKCLCAGMFVSACGCPCINDFLSGMRGLNPKDAAEKMQGHPISTDAARPSLFWGQESEMVPPAAEFWWHVGATAPVRPRAGTHPVSMVAGPLQECYWVICFGSDVKSHEIGQVPAGHLLPGPVSV